MRQLDQERAAAQRQLTREMGERRHLQRELLRRIVQAQEDERRYIARELHDETAQALTGLSFGLAGLEDMIDEDRTEVRGRLGDLRVQVEDMMKKVNQLTTQLRPTMLDDLGLVPALITYAEETSRHFPFELETKVTGQRRRLSPEVETTLYRIAQESLTNIARHAQAAHAWVHLHFGQDQVVLTVSDDGIGMADERVEEVVATGEGWGLAGIHERAMLLEGETEIRSKPGEGTVIEARIPTVPSSPSTEGNGF